MAFPFSGITPKAPTVGSSLRPPEYLTATGAAVASSLSLRAGEFATLVVGPLGVSVVWGNSPTGISATALDVSLAAGTIFSWEVDEATKYVSVFPSDGVGTFKAWLYRSS